MSISTVTTLVPPDSWGVPLRRWRRLDLSILGPGLNGTQTFGDSTQSFGFLADGISAPATALVANVTVIAGSSAGFLTIYPVNDAAPPLAGDMSFPAEGVAQNFAARLPLPFMWWPVLPALRQTEHPLRPLRQR